MNPVRLYVGPDFVEPSLISHTQLLAPFWGVVTKSSTPFVGAAMLQYQYSKNDFMLVERIEDAEYVLMPYSYERLRAANPARVRLIEEQAQRAGIPLLIDGAGDLEYPIRVPNAVIFRLSQYRYSRQPNEITIPFPVEDLLESYCGGELMLRKKSQRPSVGFMGWAALPPLARAKAMLKGSLTTLARIADPERGAEQKGVFFRHQALTSLARTPGIDLHTAIRSTYSGNQVTAGDSQEKLRNDFVENLLASDYALTVRGDANASLRFYEALSLGRIPLFLDTACVLPLEDLLDYRDFCVFVDWHDTNCIGDILLDFHRRVSPERFEDMQRKARDAYRHYLRTDAFSAHLATELRKRLIRTN